MAEVTVALHRDRLDLDRIRVQERGDALLLIDRESGRWISLGEQWRPAVQLLAAGATTTNTAAGHLRSLLVQRGIGLRGSRRRFSDLNTLILKVTAACNHACAYCYDYEEEAGARRLPRDLALQAIAEALEMCTSRLQVILHGGEPMLVWPLIEDIVTGAEALVPPGKTLRFVGQTNLSRLNRRTIEFSEGHDIQWGISLDGPAEIHDRFRTYRDGSSTYADFARSLEAHPDFVRRCSALSTITTANQGRLSEVAGHVMGLGLASWDWTLFQPIGRGRDDPRRFAVQAEVLVPAWLELYTRVTDGEFDGFPVQPVLKYVDNFLAGPGPNMCMRPECGAGRDLLSISPDGSIDACDCIDPHGPLSGLGNLGASSLADAHDSPIARHIRARDLSETQCSVCDWWGVCGGGCLAHASHRDAVPELGCAIALTAFDAIASDLTQPGGPLRRYLRSLDRGEP